MVDLRSTPEWTFDTFKEWIEAKFETVNAKLDERANAIEVKDAAFEKRMDSTNEWRQAFADLTKTMASQDQLNALKEKVEGLEKLVAENRNKSAGFSQFGTVLVVAIGVGGTLFGIIAWFVK